MTCNRAQAVWRCSQSGESQPSGFWGCMPAKARRSFKQTSVRRSRLRLFFFCLTPKLSHAGLVAPLANVARNRIGSSVLLGSVSFFQNSACNAQALAHGGGRNEQHTMKNYYAKQNQFGHWVGYIVWNGVASAVTNAQLTEHKALALAESMASRNP